MKIETLIEFSKNVEIDLSSEDIRLIFDGDPESLRSILRNFNNIATFMRGVSNERINEMGVEARNIIVEFLNDEIKRYQIHSDCTDEKVKPVCDRFSGTDDGRCKQSGCKLHSLHD